MSPRGGGEWASWTYLYLSFTSAMAYSTTDTMPLTPWAKLLMLAQELISLVTITLVIARAVGGTRMTRRSAAFP